MADTEIFFPTDDEPDVDDLTFPEGTDVQWVCRCGVTELQVCFEAGNYRTFVICPSCYRRGDAHTG